MPARQLKVAICLFCGEAPCVCNKPAKAASKPRAKKSSDPASTSAPETSKSVPETRRTAPIVRPAIPVGQGFTPDRLEDQSQIPSRPVNQPVSRPDSPASATQAPNSWAWHEDPPKPTFAQAQEMDNDWHFITAFSILLDQGLISDPSQSISEWRENRTRRLAARGDS